MCFPLFRHFVTFNNVINFLGQLLICSDRFPRPPMNFSSHSVLSVLFHSSPVFLSSGQGPLPLPVSPQPRRRPLPFAMLPRLRSLPNVGKTTPTVARTRWPRTAAGPRRRRRRSRPASWPISPSRAPTSLSHCPLPFAVRQPAAATPARAVARRCRLGHA